MIVADAVLERQAAWSRRYALAWRWVAVGVLLLLGLTPIWSSMAGDALRPAAFDLLAQWSGLQAMMLLLAAVAAAAAAGRWWGGLERTILVSALIFWGLWLFPARVIDQQKTLRPEIVAFVEAVPRQNWPRIAGWDLSETMRGCLVVYADLSVRNVADRARAAEILAGRDDEYDALLVTDRSNLEPLEGLRWRVVAAGRPGLRRLRLLQGASQ
jgi:hypothetical protein